MNICNKHKIMKEKTIMNYKSIYKEQIIDQYLDPDKFVKKNFDYYQNYCNALNNITRENSIELSNKIEFYPKKSKNGNKFSCFLKIQNCESMKLKTDQFGFSIPTYRHPPFAYFIMSSNKKNAIAFINKYIESRRLGGGSFIWPLEKSFTPYNTLRGGSLQYARSKFYIQDRVDLTLYEIKQAYDYMTNKNLNTKHNFLINYLKKHPTSNMRRFLDLFGNFELYIKIFAFDGNFVRNVDGEWKIVNILETEDLNNPKYIEDDNYINDAREGKKLITLVNNKCNISEEKLKNMLVILDKLIKKRRSKLNLPSLDI